MSLPDQRVLVMGPAAWNELIVVERLPEPRTQMTVAHAAWQTIGGTSAGKAIHLHDLGVDVRLRTPLAADEHGRLIRASLPEGLGLEAQPTERTEHHVNLMTPHGERISIYTTPPANAPLPDRDTLREAAVVVLDLAPWTRELAARLDRRDLTVWTDLHDVPADSDWHRPFWRAATVASCSDENLPRPVEFLQTLVAEGVRLAICTLGARGAVAVDSDGEVHTVAAVPTDVVDTNGAGDAFFAGVLAATLAGADVDAALRAGAKQAVRALNTRDLGPGVRSAADVDTALPGRGR